MSERLTKLLELLKEMPDDVFLVYGIALEYVSKNDDIMAQQYFYEIKTRHSSYLALYYQLGKLLERQQKPTEAAEIYNLGISLARNQKDLHTMSELQNALDELE